MELVPIVELTLGIFTGLLVLTLIISYVSYKLRKEDKSLNPAGMPGISIANQAANYAAVSNIIPQQQAAYKIQPEYAEPMHARYIPSAQFTPAQQAREESEQEKSRNSKPATKFTVLNDVPPVKLGYVPETTKSFSHKFASPKAKDAFAMFK